MRSRVLLALSCGGLLFCHALSATTLKFGSDVELLAIDGQPLPAALFKSANSLELNAGIHQMLFRVAKPLTADGKPHYSAPLIAVFDTRDATSVTIKLPRIGDDRDIRQLEQTLNFKLLNHRGSRWSTARTSSARRPPATIASSCGAITTVPPPPPSPHSPVEPTCTTAPLYCVFLAPHRGAPDDILIGYRAYSSAAYALRRRTCAAAPNAPRDTANEMTF